MAKLLQTDLYTEKNNESSKFDAKTQAVPGQSSKGKTYYSNTSHRVTVPVYNTYEKGVNKPKVFGYYTDWAMYDGRRELINPDAPNKPESWKWNSNFDVEISEAGRGVDLGKINPLAYDKIILGFVGIVGDQGAKKEAIDRGWGHVKGGTPDQVKDLGTITFLDEFSDAEVGYNVNIPDGSTWPGGTPATDDPNQGDWYKEGKTRGLFQGLKNMKVKNPDLELSFSIGGWSMSDGFYHAARSETGRKNFADSVLWHLNRFPMFTEIDIDWEYPGAIGAGNSHGEDDWEFYVMLITDLKNTLKGTAHENLKISIAISAVPDVMALSHLPDLIKAGVTGLNVMTYDFFGTGWADHVTHHTALSPTGLDYPPVGDAEPQAVSSVETAVNYLIDELDIDPSIIFVGYAGYSRNAIVKSIDSVSPLIATYEKSDGDVMGTFERGTTEWYDLIYNYFDLENPDSKGSKNGFKLYTDTIANADFLYNEETGLYMSLDTPRSVREKGKYVLDKKLGGLFTWTIDNDNGVLVNAAREGLGYTVKEEILDMKPLYIEGDTGEEVEPPEGDYPAPTNVKLVSVSHVSAQITFETPKDSASGNKVKSYEGLATPKGRRVSFPFAAVSQVVPAEIEGLDSDTEYDITVTAIYDDGTRAVSAPLSIKTLAMPAIWERGKEYKQGDVVYYPSLIAWQALEDHTATRENAPGIGSLWAKVNTRSASASRLVQDNTVTLHLKDSTVSGEAAGIATLVGLLDISKNK